MKQTKAEVRMREEKPLRWPHGQQRTLIDRREPRNAWKKTFNQYRERLSGQLQKLGVREALLSYSDSAARDPGVALYFAMPEEQDSSWQVALGIDNPNPTEDEINAAFRLKAKKHHTDEIARGSGGDEKLFLALSEHKRRALAYVRGEVEEEYCIGVDRCTEARWNLEAIRRILIASATMDEYGNPGTLKRTFRGFKVALPAHETEVNNGPTAA